jgi:hypothetical protein
MKRSEKSKKERMGLPAFFKKHIGQVTVCENCGMEIKYPGAKNVAHILPKSKMGGFPEVMCEDDNVMYLCSDLDRVDGKGCHDIYDNAKMEVVKKQPMWGIAVKRFKKFEHLLTRKSIKLLDFIQDPSYEE